MTLSHSDFKETKKDGTSNPGPLPSSVGIFSLTLPLKELCMQALSSNAHRLDEKQMGPLREAPVLHEEYVQYKQDMQKKLKCLLEAIVQGDPDAVSKMIEACPALLLEKLEEKEVIVTRSGQRSVKKTPYQMALAEEDTQMAALLRKKLITVADEKEADAQFNEQRPKDWEADEEKRWQPIFEQLNSLTQAIKDIEPGDVTSSGYPYYQLKIREGSKVAKELANFWSSLDAMLDKPATSGRHFNPNLLLKALHIYDHNVFQKIYFSEESKGPRSLLFLQKVIGYDGIQRIMPANYVQAFPDWLEKTVTKLQNGQPQGRSTQFLIFGTGNWDYSVNFYPLRPRGRSVFNFAIHGRYGLPCIRWACRHTGHFFRNFEDYVNQKQLAYRTLMPQHQNNRLESSKSSCVTM